LLFALKSVDRSRDVDDAGGVLQAAYNSSQQELGLLQEAAIEACQIIDEGAEQAGSSVASRL
jgi:hypothetical protein